MRKLRLRQDLDPVDPAKLLGCPLRQVELLIEILSERLDAVHLHGKPDAQAAPVSRELRGKQVVIRQVQVLLHRGHVIR